MKKIIIFSLFFFSLFQLQAQSQCSETVEEQELSELPSFEQADWYKSRDIYYGTHYTSWIKFSDGKKGKIFKGGSSGKYFIGDKKGGKYYYKNQRAAIRALYFYKKYSCISWRYRD